ncbi:MAG TPA: hypothetical protein VNQ31_03670 [Sphingomonadaceae bacterium]|jgi:PleD family two-component response regulator|nr:hypothetical protein [Sphingomonadaceae bacterium]
MLVENPATGIITAPARKSRLAARRGLRYRAAMTPVETYRANAAAQRAAALSTNLPNRRAMHERSAQAWDAMADNAEDTAGRALVNEAAKAAR